MFKNYLKISLRNLLRYKGYSLINIVGLAIGITCTIMIFLFVQDEMLFLLIQISLIFLIFVCYKGMLKLLWLSHYLSSYQKKQPGSFLVIPILLARLFKD